MKSIHQNANELAENFLKLENKETIKALPKNIENAIKLSKKSVYKKEGTYWQLNSSFSYQSLIWQKIQENLVKHGNTNYNKYIKMYHYNNITSLDDVKQSLLNTYDKESSAFKLHYSFGYVTEKPDSDHNYKMSLYHAGKNYFNKNAITIKNKKDMLKEIDKLNTGYIIHRVAESFPNSSTRLIGVYGLAVKIVRLDFPIGANIEIPDYIKYSPFITSLDKVKNNLCFWSCLALASGSKPNGEIKQSKELFNNFYQHKQFEDYPGFDFVNELANYENFNKQFAINIVSYDEDTSIEYIYKSPYNDDVERHSIYMNLYLDHFSYIKSLEKLAKMYLCHKCSSKFIDNANLQRHVDSCIMKQRDNFVDYPQIYETKRNVIVELCDWYGIPCDELFYRYDYMITFDLESMLEQISEQKSEKLTFVTRHVPVSVSIATNVPGFQTKHIQSIVPDDLSRLMFEQFDLIAKTAKQLMINKLQPLIDKIGEKSEFHKKVIDYCSIIPNSRIQ